MKQVVWLLLAACCLAFGQVQPATSAVADEGHCTCCDCGGTCGMPECAPPPAARTPVFAQAEARTYKAEAVRRAAPTPRPIAACLPLRQATTKASIALGLAHGRPALDTPVFLVHCSLLI